jgi:hypothetical protein
LESSGVYDKNVLESNAWSAGFMKTSRSTALTGESAGLAAAATEESIPGLRLAHAIPLWMDSAARGCRGDAGQMLSPQIPESPPRAIEFLRLTQRYPRPG